MIGSKRIVGVLLTHTHSDHIYGIKELQISFPEAIIYTNKFGYEALASPKLNFSRYHSEYDDIKIEDRTNVRIISEKSCLFILGHKVGVYETPGHDPSCLTYKIGRCFFTGDSYIPSIKVFTGFPNSDKNQAAESESQIIKLSEGLVVCPGHEV
jgi:glyoxylase-like metal-dependent hydrolase (beta-lactamase superfamily II)